MEVSDSCGAVVVGIIVDGTISKKKNALEYEKIDLKRKILLV